MSTLEHYVDWVDRNGDIVNIDGKEYRIEVRTHRAIYPYEHNAIYVDAVMVDKEDPYYLEVKEQLRDDWSTDVLSMDPDKIVELLTTGKC